MLQRTISALNLYRYSFEYLEITDQHKFSVVDFEGIKFQSHIRSVSYDFFWMPLSVFIDINLQYIN